MTTNPDPLAQKDQGLNCCQAVVAPFAEELGVDLSLALRIANPFGAGIARSGSVCGAVVGALLVIGLRHGMRAPGDAAARERTMALSRRFLERFREENGATECNALLGVDVNTPEGFETARSSGLFATVCPRAIESARRILAEL